MFQKGHGVVNVIKMIAVLIARGFGITRTFKRLKPE